ncbi:MAG TPA: hypothetical protein PK286_06865 [Devosia sp.]|nr:hypothetical protein [Devosia sp.]
MFIDHIKTGTRALVVSALIAGTSLVAVPAQAQSFSFDFGINGGGSSFSYGIGSGGKKFRRDCLTNREIRRGLGDSGFYDVQILGDSGTRVRVVATWEDNGRDYSMRVNRCTGRVTDIQRIRGGGFPGNPPPRPGYPGGPGPGHPGGPGYPGGPGGWSGGPGGMNLQFTF